MFFLAKGSCNVLIKDKFDERFEEKLVGTITPGMHFGEIGLLYGCPRSATVISSNYCTCSSINRTEYNELLILYPDLNKLIRE
jgi:CRP-like cAMP-binding protein